MAELRNQRNPNAEQPHTSASTSPEYQRGWKAREAIAREELAATLRIFAVTGASDGTRLTDTALREIFTGVFGIMAADEEFGQPPTGSFKLERLLDYPQQSPETIEP